MMERWLGLPACGRDMVDNQDDATRFRHRAEELRTLAETAKDPKLRDGLENWAKEYDRMAEQAAALRAQRS